MIEFLCPEGHKIRCPEEKAGRPAKCPKCGVGFRIPTIQELGSGESAIADASLVGDEVTDVPVASPLTGGSGKQPVLSPAPTKERQIEFLCPNGHHLHGPASLQGRAGECPECSSRFRIPVIDEPEGSHAEHEASTKPDVPAEDEITLENPSLMADSGQAQSPLDFLQVLENGGSEPAKILNTSGGPGGGGAI